MTRGMEQPDAAHFIGDVLPLITEPERCRLMDVFQT